MHRSAATRDVEITLDAGLVLRATFGCLVAIVLLGVLASYALVSQAGVPKLVISAFLLDAEANVPTFFSFGLLVFCSLLLALIGARAFLARQPFRFHWALLAALFFFIAFDEAARVHEKLNEPVRAALDVSGWMHFAWVVPVGGLVAVLALFYLPFLRSLPAPFGRLFVLSGVLYVGGALGAEMAGAAYFEVHGTGTFVYQLMTIVEETLEMLGLAVFANALIRFLARQDGGTRLGIRA